MSTPKTTSDSVTSSPEPQTDTREPKSKKGRESAKASVASATTSRLTRFQKFATVRMARSEISGCPFNPRKISPYNRRKLRDNLSKMGLLNALVFNKRTGHLLSGHQRLSILDDLEGNDRYAMDVDVVDVSEAEEKNMVVFFNNAMQTQGEYDWQAFDAALKSGEVDIEGCGFTIDGLSMIYDETGLDAWFIPGAENEMSAVDDLDEAIDESIEAEEAVEEERNTAEEIAGFRARRAAYEQEASEENSAHFSVSIIFPNEAHKASWLELCSLSPRLRYLDAKDFLLVPRVEWDQVVQGAAKFESATSTEYNEDGTGPGEAGDIFSEGEIDDDDEGKADRSGAASAGSGTEDPQVGNGQPPESVGGKAEGESGSGAQVDSQQRARRKGNRAAR